VGSADMHDHVRYVPAEIYLSRYHGAINTLVYIGVYLNVALRTANDSQPNVRICLVSTRRDKRVSSNSTKKTAIVSDRAKGAFRHEKRNIQRPPGA